MFKHKLPGLDGRLPAYTLTELLVVLVIIGILVLLALPNHGDIIGKAYATEAKLQLEHLYSLEKAHFYEYSRYSEDLADIGYAQQELISEGGNARYRIEIQEASAANYKATATAVVDFDQDGQFNIWEIDHQQKLKEVVKD